MKGSPTLVTLDSTTLELLWAFQPPSPPTQPKHKKKKKELNTPAALELVLMCHLGPRTRKIEI